jgi:hypothetical protein
MEKRFMRKLRIANVAVLFIMILVMVLVNCEMVKLTDSTNVKFRLKSQVPGTRSIHSILASRAACRDFGVLPKNSWEALAPSYMNS